MFRHGRLGCDVDTSGNASRDLPTYSDKERCFVTRPSISAYSYRPVGSVPWFSRAVNADECI